MSKSKKRNLKWKLEYVIAAIIIAIIMLVSTYHVVAHTSKNDHIKVAKVTKVLDITNDGGFVYQNIEAKVLENDDLINIKIELTDKGLEQINKNDQIYVKKVDSSLGDIYNFSGYRRLDNLIWIALIFAIIMVITMGRDGIKYILPAILLLILIVSGTLQYYLLRFNPYIVSLIVLSAISLSSILIQVKNIRVALLVTISQIVTLSLILFVNLVLFKVSFLAENFYRESTFMAGNVSIWDYWEVSNVVVIYLAFGTSINTTFDVVHAILIKKKKYPSSTISSLLREGNNNTKIIGGRVTNNLFFVLLGVSLNNILFFDKNKYWYFIDDPVVVQNLILFINAALAALIAAPITSLVTVLYLANKKERDNFSFID